MINDRLIPILQNKKQEIAILKQLIANDAEHVIARVLLGEKLSFFPRNSFELAIARGDFIKIIAEIKRHSPSKGQLATITDPLCLAKEYQAAGASAISILTDFHGFKGSLEDLKQVKTHLTGIPLLRKDFLLEPIQIAESIVAGADCILLIATILGHTLPEMIKVAEQLQIDALVEVHTAAELELALESGAKIIGVNNRDLHSFQVNTQCAFDLIQHIPKDIIAVAESGIHDPALAREYYAAGFSAVLVGEALVKLESPTAWIHACHVD
ncbi:MAG: indole-3-glycerol phosphate synthase TrpC [Gammaproteobacteria bacterium]